MSDMRTPVKTVAREYVRPTVGSSFEPTANQRQEPKHRSEVVSAPRKPSVDPDLSDRDMCSPDMGPRRLSGSNSGGSTFPSSQLPQRSPFVVPLHGGQTAAPDPHTPVKKRLFEDDASGSLCLHLHRKAKRDGRSIPREVPHYVADEEDESEMLCLDMSTLATLDTPPAKKRRFERR